LTILYYSPPALHCQSHQLQTTTSRIFFGPPSRGAARWGKEQQRKIPPVFWPLDCQNSGGIVVSCDVVELAGSEPASEWQQIWWATGIDRLKFIKPVHKNGQKRTDLIARLS